MSLYRINNSRLSYVLIRGLNYVTKCTPDKVGLYDNITLGILYLYARRQYVVAVVAYSRSLDISFSIKCKFNHL